MNIKEFKDFHNLKETEETIESWITNGYIPGTTRNISAKEWVIPDDSWPPYTQARASKKTDSIYTSILRAVTKRRRPIAKLYKLSDNEFNVYIQNLLKYDLIDFKVIDGIDYYYATTSTTSYLKSNSSFSKFTKSLVPIVTIGLKLFENKYN